MDNIISFYPRFCEDICNGLKTITIRNAAEAYYEIGKVVTAITYPSGDEFALLKINSITKISLDELTIRHANQENMPLAELKALIPKIYPNESQFYLLSFNLVKSCL